MSHARAFANGVVLPDGTVLIVGGQSYAKPFTDTTPVFATELFNPSTRKWTTLADIRGHNGRGNRGVFAG
ncbi:hypothetical protein F4809DRAFT_615313 [Biscogniauxia mediterranea]|nr:hypothetical protein F4809DRAFT_615313 [Biscogniauxia mediterranea]